MSATAKRKKSSSHKYPPHAPPELCKLYEMEKRNGTTHYTNILGALLGKNDSDEFKAMDSVWKVLTEKGMTGSEAVWWYTFYVYPSATCGPDAQQHTLERAQADHVKRIKQAAAGPFAGLVATPDCPKVWAKLTQNEKKDRIEAIAEAASTLHSLLEHTPFDRSVFRYIGGTNAKVLLQLFRESPTYLTDVDQGSMSDEQFLESIWPQPTMTDVLFVMRLMALANDKQEYSRFPGLELLADDLVRNPGIANADRNYFILRMAGYFKERFKTPLLGTITSMTKVVFADPDLTKNAVATVIKGAAR